ncbi:HtaA domain-containing protein [Microbacterium sp. LWS13-1.2]|uniref:HtaA domain-containing protein n=1 Tax=Microbacterium sp. LWS13-1.2 TaxID=3135264 RepID=A0AAU6SBS9_9MICO
MTEQGDQPREDGLLIAAGRTEAALLVWGVKASFRSYVAGVGGEITCSDGAIELPEGFGFPIRGVEADGTLAAAGSVVIRAHGGLLNVELRDPRLARTPGGDELSIVGAARRVIVATAAAGDPAATVSPALELHPDAVALFDGTYPPGTELDPVHFLRYREGAAPEHGAS